MSSHNIYKLIDAAEVVSFDIFDTLLLRPYMKPADMFQHLEKIYLCSGYARQRMKAESVFYNKYGRQKEANIDDIYKVLPDYANMKQSEIDWELQILSLNPEMKKIYDYVLKAGKKVIISSDMYLPLDFVESLLAKNKIYKYAKLYLSNEINCRKDRGDMYDYILQDLKVKPESILHIGDNKKSDYEQARKHGLRAFHYVKTADIFLKKDHKFAKLYKSLNSSLGVSIITALAAQRDTTDDYWIEFGYKYAGPTAYAYTRWIFDIALQNKLSNILFVARDGYLMEKVFKTFNHDIATSYVYAPRILNYTANLDYNPKASEQTRIICEYFKKDTGNLTPKDFIDKNIAEFQALTAKEKEKTGYSQYIKELVKSHKSVGVVDSISGQLSGQRLIEKESGTKTTGFYILTLPGQKCLREFEHYDYFSADLHDAFIKDSKCDLMELIFSAPENPIITLQHGKPVHAQVLHEAEKARHEIYRKIESGALAFARDVFKRFNGENIYLQSIDLFTLLNIYVTKPNSKDIRAMFEVKKSPYADNSLYIPLFAAPIPFYKTAKTSKLIWHTPMQRLGLILAEPLRFKMRGLKKIELTFLPHLRHSVLEISFFNRFRLKIGA